MLPGVILLREFARATSPSEGIRSVLVADGYSPALDSLEGRVLAAASTAGRVVLVTPAVLRKIAGVENADSLHLLTEIEIESIHGTNNNTSTSRRCDEYEDLTRLSPTRVLALDRIQDPGNLGTLVRTAVAFGWDAIYLLPGCCDPFHERCIRASRGGVFKVSMFRGTAEDLRVEAGNLALRLVAAEPEAGEQEEEGGGSSSSRIHSSSSSSRTSSSLSPKQQQQQQLRGVCLVLGSEGQGVSKEVLAHCLPLPIPMVGDMESLNVGVAGGILMYVLGPTGGEGGTRKLRREAGLSDNASLL